MPSHILAAGQIPAKYAASSLSSCMSRHISRRQLPATSTTALTWRREASEEIRVRGPDAVALYAFATKPCVQRARLQFAHLRNRMAHSVCVHAYNYAPSTLFSGMHAKSHNTHTQHTNTHTRHTPHRHTHKTHRHTHTTHAYTQRTHCTHNTHATHIHIARTLHTHLYSCRATLTRT